MLDAIYYILYYGMFIGFLMLDIKFHWSHKLSNKLFPNMKNRSLANLITYIPLYFLFYIIRLILLFIIFFIIGVIMGVFMLI